MVRLVAPTPSSRLGGDCTANDVCRRRRRTAAASAASITLSFFRSAATAAASECGVIRIPLV